VTTSTEFSEILARWEARRDEYRRLHVHVDGALMIDELLADLRTLREAESLGVVSLQEAHLIGGYAIDSLQRMVASGQIENVGRKGKPRIRRADVPVKPGYSLRGIDAADQLSPRRRIVRSALTHTQTSA